MLALLVLTYSGFTVYSTFTALIFVENLVGKNIMPGNLITGKKFKVFLLPQYFLVMHEERRGLKVADSG
jgi:hypothetical protein